MFSSSPQWCLLTNIISKSCFQPKIRTLFQVDIPNMLLPSPLAYSPKQDSIFIQQKPFTVSNFLQNTLAIMAESQKTKFVAQVFFRFLVKNDVLDPNWPTLVQSVPLIKKWSLSKMANSSQKWRFRSKMTISGRKLLF